jgi:succinate-acetate transporter protein
LKTFHYKNYKNSNPRHKHAKWPPSDLTPWTLTLASPELLLSNSGLLLLPDVLIVARAVLGLSGLLTSSLECKKGLIYKGLVLKRFGSH